MNNLMINNVNITGILTDNFKKLKDKWITLMRVPIIYSSKTTMESIKILQNLGYKGIYITLSQPTIKLMTEFKEYGIKTDELYFVDGITEMYNEKKVQGNIEYVKGPLAIDSITKAVQNFNSKLGKINKFVFLDSITTVLIYNALSRTIEFSRFLIEDLRKAMAIGIVVSIASGTINQHLLKELENMSDEVLDLETILTEAKNEPKTIK